MSDVLCPACVNGGRSSTGLIPCSCVSVRSVSNLLTDWDALVSAVVSPLAEGRDAGAGVAGAGLFVYYVLLTYGG
jgi:hypothetical protein